MLLLSACTGSFLSSSGPSSSSIQSFAKNSKSIIQVISVNSQLMQELIETQNNNLFSKTFISDKNTNYTIKSGDVVSINIWEADPPILFSGTQGLTGANGNQITIPEQMVNFEGHITIPFAGKIVAHNKTISEIENKILESLRSKANQPQVMLSVSKNLSSAVTVVGEAGSGALVPLTPKGETILDVLAAVGGVKQAVDKVTIQLTRNNVTQSLSLGHIIKDSKENIKLEPGDVLTAFSESNSFTVLGGAAKSGEVNFGGNGLTLVQAIGKIGGTIDSKADPKGIFIFRFEDPETLGTKYKPKIVTKDNKAAVIYQINMEDPATFFVAQNFSIKNKDVLYVSNSGSAELQKFLNVVISIVYPLVNLDRLTGNY
jgi:polysaccharide export outer membrane protein